MHEKAQHWPSTATGQFGALVGASNQLKIAWSAFITVIENPTTENNGSGNIN